MPIEDLLGAAAGADHLHLILHTLGGDGEAAVRLARQLQGRCRELTVVIPHQAKSAGTLLALGAHRILMGLTSDLGPVDPQLWVDGAGFRPAKSIVAAFEYAERAVVATGGVASFHAQTLANGSAFTVQSARDELGHTDALMRQALLSNPDWNEAEIEELMAALGRGLVVEPQSHAALVSGRDAWAFGLPVSLLDADE